MRGTLYAWVMEIRDRMGGGGGVARTDGFFVKACRAFLLKISLKREKTKSAPCVLLGELKEDQTIMWSFRMNPPINVSQPNVSAQPCGHRECSKGSDAFRL